MDYKAKKARCKRARHNRSARNKRKAIAQAQRIAQGTGYKVLKVLKAMKRLEQLDF